VEAGWYADYTGARRMRWWNGQQWTDYVSMPAISNYREKTPRIPAVPATTPVGNIFFWLLVALPVITTALSFSVDFGTTFLEATTRPTNLLAIFSSPGLVGWLGASVLAPVAKVILSYFDFRKLRSSGFDRPFHWAWAFVIGVYLIGRTVVVRRRSGRGVSLLLIWIGVYAFSTAVVVAETISALLLVLHNGQGSFTNA